MCRLLSGYPGLTREYVLFELPEAEGRAMVAWLHESDSQVAWERDGDGYIEQERKRLMGLLNG